MKYRELKERQSKEINELPIYWVFGEKSKKDLMEKLEIKDDKDFMEKVFTFGGGSIVLKKDKQLITDTFKRHENELKKSIEDDNFLQDAIEYELSNHEYICTCDVEPALSALGITWGEYIKGGRIYEITEKAVENYILEMKKLGW